MGEEADADWQAGLAEWGRESAKLKCDHCDNPATIITKPSRLLCNRCARKMFPHLK